VIKQNKTHSKKHGMSNIFSAIYPAATGFPRLSFFYALSGQLLLTILIFSGYANPAKCNDSWDQFRGKGRNGHVSVPTVHKIWVEPAPEMLWSREIGSGFSEVVVANNTLYLMMAEKTDSVTGWETLVAMDPHNGDIIWSTRLDTVFIDVDDWGDGPRSTPAIDETTVYCFSASGKLVAVDRKDGAIRWSVDFVKEYGSTRPRWGYATSPLLSDNKVIMEVGGRDDHGFAAFEKASGAVVWHSANVVSGYNSAVMAIVENKPQVIFANGSRLYAFDMNGDSLWTYTMPLRSPMALPLFIEPNLLFVSAANDAGSFIVRLDENPPVEVARSSVMRNDWSSSCHKDGFIYGFNVATLQCIDAQTGQRQWLKRGFGKGSLIMVNDRLIILSDLGTLTLAEATPEGYREIAIVEALNGRSWTAPSYANGNLYVRNHTHIACFRIMQNVALQGQPRQSVP